MTFISIPNGNRKRIALSVVPGDFINGNDHVARRIALAGILDSQGMMAFFTGDEIEPCLFDAMDRGSCIVGAGLLSEGYRLLQNYRPRSVEGAYATKTWDVASLLVDATRLPCPPLDDLGRWNGCQNVGQGSTPGSAGLPRQALHRELSILLELADLVDRRGWVAYRFTGHRCSRHQLPRPRDFYSVRP